MATLWTIRIALLSCLATLASARVSVDKFKQLEQQVFGENKVVLYDYDVEKKINDMISLLELGDVPAEVYGKRDLNYLRSLLNDCAAMSKCNFDSDLEKLHRLGQRKVSEPSLSGYLQICTIRVRENCKADIHRYVIDKLRTIGQSKLDTIDAIAQQVDRDQRRQSQGRNNVYGDASELDIYYPRVVLKALKKLDPEGAKKLLKKWTYKQEAMERFMDKIRQSCVAYLGNVDRIVEIFPFRYWKNANSAMLDLQNWHVYKKICENIVGEWDKIVELSFSEYQKYLRDSDDP